MKDRYGHQFTCINFLRLHTRDGFVRDIPWGKESCPRDYQLPLGRSDHDPSSFSMRAEWRLEPSTSLLKIRRYIRRLDYLGYGDGNVVFAQYDEE